MKKFDVIFCIVLTVLAALPRFYHIGFVPLGIHGDEGWTGLDAIRLMQNGWIEPYVDSGLGQPTLPLYLTAFLFKTLGVGIFQMRLSMAIFAVATFPLLYIFLRIYFSQITAFLVTLCAAFTLYHIHFSRIAFMCITVPFFQLGTLILLTIAHKKHSRTAYFAAGCISGLGLGSYNTFFLFPISMIVVLSMIFLHKGMMRWNNYAYIGSYMLGVFMTGLPILSMMIMTPSFYFSHHQLIALWHQQDFLALHTIGARMHYLFAHAFVNLWCMIYGHIFDGVDGYGLYEGLDVILGINALIGLIFLIWKQWQWAVIWLFLAGTSPVPVVTTIDGQYRREILFFVYMCWLAGYGWEQILKRVDKRFANYVIVFTGFIIICASIYNVSRYFTQFATNPMKDIAFPPELLLSIEAANSHLPHDAHVLFFSDRWGCTYETIRFLSHFECTDASDEFGYIPVKKLQSEMKNIQGIVLLGKYIFHQELYKELSNRMTQHVVTYQGQTVAYVFVK